MSEEDFARFYEASFSRVVSAVRAFCGDADVAFESTQEAFARACSRWRRVRQNQSPEGWVVATAMNLARRHFRRPRAEVRPAEPRAREEHDDRMDVLAALRALPARQREAAVLYYLIDLPITAVAEMMGVSEGAVKAHLHKARSGMRDSLEVRHA